jgi:hypothetical protein
MKVPKNKKCVKIGRKSIPWLPRGGGMSVVLLIIVEGRPSSSATAGVFTDSVMIYFQSGTTGKR